MHLATTGDVTIVAGIGTATRLFLLVTENYLRCTARLLKVVYAINRSNVSGLCICCVPVGCGMVRDVNELVRQGILCLLEGGAPVIVAIGAVVRCQILREHCVPRVARGIQNSRLLSKRDGGFLYLKR